MQAGISFIVSDFPAWQVEASKVTTGLYVNLESAEEILSASINFCESEDRRREMGSAGSDYVRKHFDWDFLEVTFLEFAGIALNDRVAADSRVS